uniref:Uncharacterized protein n=1 Tax=Neobodo designis TaxID=312471 RepID=A0A7S1LCZ9_NEODS
MLAGVRRMRRKQGFDVRVGRATSSRVFDQFCPMMRRTGRCALYEAQVARADEALRKRKAALEEEAATAELIRAAAAGDEEPLTEEELQALEADREPLPAVELWHECPFRHQRSAVAASERDAIVDRMVEFFTLGKVRLTLHRRDVDPDATAAEVAEQPTVTCDVPTRRGRMIIASNFAARFGAYLGLDDAPPQYQGAEDDDADEKPAPITGPAGPTAQAAEKVKRLPAFRRRRRRIVADVAEFRTTAELTLRSVRVCEYLSQALAKMKARGMSVDGAILSHNDITDLDPLLQALKKRRLHESICFLDASNNELETLRFLFYLRANFPNLVSLRLLNNPITRKPEYREQLRKTLPKLLRLDDESVRKPPLTLPFPKPSASPMAKDFDSASRFVAALLDSFERGLVDEDFAQRHFHPSVTYSLSVHPDCIFQLPTYAMTAEEQAAREKQSAIEAGKTARRLRETLLVTPQDKREAQLFDVAVRGQSRDLRVGREAIEKYARGQLLVFQAYTSTIYPARFAAEHHLHFAAWDVSSMPIPLATLSTKVKRLPVAAGQSNAGQMPAPVKKKKAPKLPTVSGGAKAVREVDSDDDDGAEAAQAADAAAEGRPVFAATRTATGFDLVTIHGVMSWRIPSMHGELAFRCHYDRTMTLLPKPRVGGDDDANESEDLTRWASEDDLIDALDRYFLYNDQVTLRPVLTHDIHDVHRRDVVKTNDTQCRPVREAAASIYDPRNRPEFARRLAMVFQTDEATVRRALEQATSDACLHRVLEELTGAEAGQLAVERVDETVAVDDADAGLDPLAVVSAVADGAEGESAQERLEPLLRRHRTEPFVLPEPAEAPAS